MLLQLGEFGLALQHQHDLEAVLLGGSQENQAFEVSDVFGVVGEIGVELEVEVDVQIDGAHDGKAVGVLLLVDHQQPRTVFLPLFALDVDEKFGPCHEKDRSAVLLESPLQLFLKKRVYLHEKWCFQYNDW